MLAAVWRSKLQALRFSQDDGMSADAYRRATVYRDLLVGVDVGGLQVLCIRSHIVSNPPWPSVPIILA